MAMVIVQGVFSVEPEHRQQFLEANMAAMRSVRQEAGCLEYVFAADPVDPSRVVLSERWESAEDLDNHLKRARSRQEEAGAQPAPRPATLSHEITVYEISASRPLG